MRLDPFYPIVDTADWAARIVPLGVRLLQLRIKDRPGPALREEIARTLALCRAHGSALVVNDHWQAAIDLGAPWVHLGQEDLAAADLAAIRRAGLRLGVSTHSHEELETALAAKPDYVALGPVYPTTLKVMPWAPQGLERLAEWRRLVGGLPLVAIGGLTLERAAGAYAAGADTVSVVSDVTKAADPEGRVRAWLEATAERRAA